MIADKKRRLVVNVNDLRRKNPVRAQNLLNCAFEEQLAFQKALKEYITTISQEYSKDNEEFFVAFEGSFGNKHVTPRSLNSRYLGNLICVEGIVTKCTYDVLVVQTVRDTLVNFRFLNSSEGSKKCTLLSSYS